MQVKVKKDQDGVDGDEEEVLKKELIFFHALFILGVGVKKGVGVQKWVESTSVYESSRIQVFK